MAVVALSTIDNPYDPFTEWNEWFVWDTTNGYDSASLLARIVLTSEELSDAEQESAIEDAVDEIVYN